MKAILVAAALTAIVAAAAVAQTTTVVPKSDAGPPPAASVSKLDGMFYSQRGEWRASKLMGANVTNSANETIGDINDVLIDGNGKVAAIVIGVGGFLGMGERHAAVSFGSLKLSRDANNNPLVRVDVTKEQLKAAPEWKWQSVSAN